MDNRTSKVVLYYYVRLFVTFFFQWEKSLIYQGFWLFCISKTFFEKFKKVMQKKIRCFSEKKRYEGVFVVHIAQFGVLCVVFVRLTLHKFCAIMSTVQRDKVPLRVPWKLNTEIPYRLWEAKRSKPTRCPALRLDNNDSKGDWQCLDGVPSWRHELVIKEKIG